MPLAAAVAGTVGMAAAELNPFGPLHWYLAPAGTLVAESVNVLPVHAGEALATGAARLQRVVAAEA